MVVQAYTVCIGVTLECRWMESEMIGDGRGCADKADKAYHDITPLLCCYVSEQCSASLMSGGGVMQLEWEQRRSAGHWGAGGGIPLQQLGHGPPCGGATRYCTATTRRT